jgi:hypothetical protein
MGCGRCVIGARVCRTSKSFDGGSGAAAGRLYVRRWLFAWVVALGSTVLGAMLV